MGASVGLQMATGALAGSAEYLAEQGVAGREATVGGLAISATVGVVAGAAAGKIANAGANRFVQSATKNSFDPVSGIIDAATGKGNFAIRGIATRAESDALGKTWVGDGGRQTSNGIEMISADGTKVYRPPTTKNSPYATTGTQSNFESKIGKKIVSNGHLNISN